MLGKNQAFVDYNFFIPPLQLIDVALVFFEFGDTFVDVVGWIPMLDC